MAETNLITKKDAAKAREVEFAETFGASVGKLAAALGVCRRIAKPAGTVLKTYRASGTLESGDVGEGETIPLSKYKTEAVPYKEITLKKWRLATSAEAIIDHGYDGACEAMTDVLLRDVQKSIRRSFFEFLATGTGTASGATFQASAAQAWGKLGTLFEDDEIDAVFFMNPLDVADYLATAPVTMQTAFGMSYIENFLGIGTVIMSSLVPKGTLYATAKDNIILVYIPVDGDGISDAFTFTTDETGIVGIHEEPDYTNMTDSVSVVCGCELYAEKPDGIIVATIGE